MPRSGIARSYGSPIFNVLRLLQANFHDGYIDLYPHQYENALGIPHIPSIFVVKFHDNSISDWG